MRKIVFLVSILGILILFVLLLSMPPIKITNSSQLDNFTANQKLIVSGKVINEEIYKKTRTLTLDSNIQVVCANCPSFKDKKISVLGTLDLYNKPKIIALKITLVP